MPTNLGEDMPRQPSLPLLTISWMRDLGATPAALDVPPSSALNTKSTDSFRLAQRVHRRDTEKDRHAYINKGFLLDTAPLLQTCRS